MSVTAQCRDIKQLNPLVQVMLELALVEIKSQGVNPLVVETYRTQERQNYLYCQGRTTAECIAKGICASFAKAYCSPKASKVTWTLSSVHASHKAVDVVPQRKVNGAITAIWNTKDTQTQIIIATMQKYGFEAGANWTSSPDSPHFQANGDFSTLFLQGSNTAYVTRVIQTALNSKIKAGLKIDGAWGAKTTAAINAFRNKNSWNSNGKLGTTALKKLLG